MHKCINSHNFDTRGFLCCKDEKEHQVYIFQTIQNHSILWTNFNTREFLCLEDEKGHQIYPFQKKKNHLGPSERQI